MSKDAFDAEAFMAAAAGALGLEIEEAWKPGVIDNLVRSRAIAQAFLGQPLPDDTEPAAIFKA